MIKLYDTRRRQKVDFEPVEPGKVSMYVCGPTVYNRIHIGNARTFISFDMIRRYLSWRGFDVTFVQNVTDVDDKIIRRAAEEARTAAEVAEEYTCLFIEDMRAAGVQDPDIRPKATEEIGTMIALIERLIERGHAYVSEGDVYFDVRSYPGYGQLSGRDIDEAESGHRELRADGQGLEERKRDELDFALWKAAKPGEIKWDSPWGAGRPGWHIECSVMSTKYLGDTLDIHAGGQDLEFPHHENEIAQSEAKTGHRFVNYWMHNGFVTIGRDNEKMSKSLGNFVTVHDLIKEVDPQVLRFFMSTTQYRRPIQYSQESLVEAQANLEHLKNTYDNLAYRLKDATSGTDGGVQRQLADFRARFVAAMDDDINVQNGIAVVYELMRFANQYVEQRLVQREPIVAIQLMLKRLVAVFGVDLAVSATEINDEKIKELIEKRNAARAEKDFALSDQIRDQLRDQGIILEDTPQGTRYRKESN